SPEKCSFYQKEVEFVGYRVSEGGVAMDNQKVKAVLDWKAPRSVKEVQQFLGFANFYRCFIKDFSKIAAPITDLVQKTGSFFWSPRAEQAFEDLKRAFTISCPPEPGTPIRNGDRCLRFCNRGGVVAIWRGWRDSPSCVSLSKVFRGR